MFGTKHIQNLILLQVGTDKNLNNVIVIGLAAFP